MERQTVRLKKREGARHKEAFEAWYEADRNSTKVSNQVTVSRKSLYQWADDFNWHERADARDRTAQRIADEDAAKAKAERATKRRQAAELLTIKGVQFLAQHPITDERAAIMAIRYGLELQRKEDGLPDWVVFILAADQNALEAMAQSFGLPVEGGAALLEGDVVGDAEDDGEE